MPRVALCTLGCKVNQYETEKIAEEFRSQGFELVEFSGEADVYVVNTCTVTRTADSKSRQAARSAVRRSRGATVVVTGCYVETSPEELQKVDGVTMVVGNEGKTRLVEDVMAQLSHAEMEKLQPFQFSAPEDGRTRALLKVQDGCDRYCSYCVVPFARPVMSSRPSSEVAAEAQELARRGFKEVVLTGIRLGRYEDGELDLTGLLRTLIGMPGLERIRLSSIELTDIPTGLVNLMAQERKLCRHLHVPLQSGDDGVLARMNRAYTAAEFASFVQEARLRVPGVAVTSDVMVGFPGETVEEFENTYRFVEEIRFARTHVFRYSVRPRTAAAGMRDDVLAAEKNRRSAQLMDLAARCSEEFARALVGKTVPVLVEGTQVGGGMLSGLTDNYVRVQFESAACKGQIADVRIESLADGVVCGRLAV